MRGVWGETADAEPPTTEFVLGEAKRLREAHPNRKLTNDASIELGKASAMLS